MALRGSLQKVSSIPTKDDVQVFQILDGIAGITLPAFKVVRVFLFRCGGATTFKSLLRFLDPMKTGRNENIPGLLCLPRDLKSCLDTMHTKGFVCTGMMFRDSYWAAWEVTWAGEDWDNILISLDKLPGCRICRNG